MKRLNWSLSALGLSIFAVVIASGCGSDDSPGEGVPGAGDGQSGANAGGAGGEMSASAAGSGGSGGMTETLPLTPKVSWDYTGIIGTGQSLAVGATAGNITPKATMQPYSNLKLSLGTAVVPPFNSDDPA